MEHRWSTRIPLSTQVILSRNMLPAVECVAKDIGRGGLFVETDPTYYTKNATLGVCITLETEHGMQQFQLLACVIHLGDTGVGLMILEHEDDFSSHVRQLILNRVQVRDHVSDARVYDSGRSLRRAAG